MFSDKKKIPRQVKDQLTPLIQKLMNICTNTKVLNRQAEWEEMKNIFELLKSVQDIEASYNPPQWDRNKNWNAFYEWCKDNEAIFSSVFIKEINDGEFGVFADKDIKEDEQFLLIPRKIMMSETSAQSSKLGPLISSDPILKNMPNVQVSMHLLMESLNPESFWMPYISILPSRYNTIHYFTFEELKDLQGSPVLEEVFQIFRSIVRQYCYFFLLFQKDTLADSLNIGPYFTYELYRWAVSSVMTRQNIIPTTEDGHMSISLIPLFDMCNHANGKLSTDFNLEKDSLVSYSFKAFSKGDQVFMFYGPRTNGEFFVHNGFVYTENENDAIEIKLGISKNDPLHSLKCSVCDKLNLSVNGPYFLYPVREILEELLSFVKINVMKSEELEKILNGDKEQIDALLSENSDLKNRAYSFLRDRLFLLLRSYKTTLEEDEEFLKQDTFESMHQHIAILLRLSEKKILKTSHDYCVSQLKEL
ncbi:actin-histidine N-methyltransferase isoform X1 [Parasteatoda tepidariorum]|uniref:actin-histidine N-methyltransferase isoform X1 n=1 Tax=Parasteatoda tepidariorum TaxID=114398 RepID=UPI001C71BA7D|nr:actin-histidine N-methyltransferase isoform X1 [Parasteatoda tepidariorum]XP_042896435.1 actin-histidine N-methyltransferase isoform X1 [Parasteatoda tepidariorum]XP_042896436.1 actin-histidine N-methyltransferase isoform X1 [Parasteatoda tepidariorum]XP_042896437.1 actin-histidine N-methyltransferase isoform X1 [Parasteatoda tepidariorum]XP_042896438.1 actin-histidine N-methyltransferase isoform X1 [Parasteatoda tepidariorum]XP_042896439.1 actin-histidine N-methyltransferase isoform X1 [Pa